MSDADAPKVRLFPPLVYFAGLVAGHLVKRAGECLLFLFDPLPFFFPLVFDVVARYRERQGPGDAGVVWGGIGRVAINAADRGPLSGQPESICSA
jgi:hypothetical protein